MSDEEITVIEGSDAGRMGETARMVIKGMLERVGRDTPIGGVVFAMHLLPLKRTDMFSQPMVSNAAEGRRQLADALVKILSDDRVHDLTKSEQETTEKLVKQLRREPPPDGASLAKRSHNRRPPGRVGVRVGLAESCERGRHAAAVSCATRRSFVVQAC